MSDRLAAAQLAAYDTQQESNKLACQLEDAEAALAAERIENVRLRAAFLTMERGYNLAAAVLEDAEEAKWVDDCEPGETAIRVNCAAWEAWRGRQT